MPYRVGAKGSYGCSGYPALKVGTNEVMGCHETRTQAAAQIYAINQSEGNIGKNMHTLKEGDFVMGTTTEGLVHGMIEHIMTEGGTLGTPGSEYALVSMPPENPAMSVRLYEEEDGEWEPTAYSIGMMYADAQKIDIKEHEMDAEETMKSYHSENEDEDKWDNMTKACWVGYEQRGMKEKDGRMVPNCVPAKKATLANAPYQDANSEREMKEEDKEIEEARRRMVNQELGKAKEPNYDEMIRPRRGGSAPSNPRLYARIVQEAKDKFDTYPSAVANGWVVQEYKRRGGTYKSEKQITKGIWNGGIFDPRDLIK